MDRLLSDVICDDDSDDLYVSFDGGSRSRQVPECFAGNAAGLGFRLPLRLCFVKNGRRRLRLLLGATSSGDLGEVIGGEEEAI